MAARSHVPAPVKSLAFRGLAAYGRWTSAARPLPDFVVIGGQRCGTGSLYDHLTSHPQVVGPRIKEVHYFDLNYLRGASWYRGHFPAQLGDNGRARPLAGESTPYYLYHPHCPARLASLLPRCKLVALLRNPVDRAISHYHHEVARRRETLPIEEAFGREEERVRGEVQRMEHDPSYQSEAHQRWSYLSRGIYVDQLERWHRHFPAEQLLVLRSEDLFTDPARRFRDVLEFLELPAHEPSDFRVRNAREYAAEGDETRSFLRDYFAPHNERLSRYLGRDLGWDG
jgi:hypothetical protein